LGGLTMSDEGGLDDVAEFFRAAASCSWSVATVASSAASRASKRRQFGQDFRALVVRFTINVAVSLVFDVRQPRLLKNAAMRALANSVSLVE